MERLTLKKITKHSLRILDLKKYLLVLLLMLGACTGVTEYVPVNSNTFGEISKLNILIHMNQDLTLINRSQENLGAVDVLGPLVSAGVRGNLKAEDKRKMERITSGKQFHGKNMFSRNLEETLNASGRFQEISIIKDKTELKKLGEAEIVLTLRVHKWGVKTIKGSDGKIKSFMDIQILMNNNGSDKLLLSDRRVVSYHTDNNLSDYMENLDLLEADIYNVIGKASKKIAMLMQN